MKRLLVIIFLLSTFIGRSQIITDSVIPFNCHGDGAIYLTISPDTLNVDWYFDDDSLGLINVDSMPYIKFNGFDTLITQQGGSYKLFDGVDTTYCFIRYPLGSSGIHKNVRPCHGDANGLLQRTAHSGSPPYLHQWFNSAGDTLQSDSSFISLLDNLDPGIYSYFLTDSAGCDTTIYSTIKEPSQLVFDTISTVNINCRRDSTGSISFSISGGKKYDINNNYFYYLYLDTILIAFSDTSGHSLNYERLTVSQNTIDSSPDSIRFNSLSAGEYTLSVIDKHGCTLDSTFEIKEPVPYEATVLNYDSLAICESDSGSFRIESIVGDSLLGSDSLSYKFLVSNEDTLFTSSGLYQIEIEDLGFNCIDTITVKCKAKYEIKINAETNHVNCFGDSTGEIVIDSIYDGNAPYDRQWGGLDSTALPAGTHIVHIVDAIGCLKTEVYVVTQGDQIIPNDSLFHPICYTDTNGSITINISGGVSPYSYSLNGMSQVNSLNGLSAGLYPLYVEDDNGCLDTFNLSLQVDTLVVLAENYQSQLSCFGELTTVDLLISGGTTPYSILWDDGDTNLNRAVGAGSYTIEVTDSNDCAAQDLLIIITEPDSLSISIADTAISCTDGGVATAIVSGGVAPFLYLWNTGDTTQTIDSLWASVYWVIVTDSCGNSITDTVYFDEYELFVEVYYDDSTHLVEVEIDSTISSGPFEHIWYDEGQGSLHDSIGYGPISPVLCEGTYFVVTTDVSNNCYVVDTFDVEFNLPLNGIVDITTTTVFPNSDLWGFAPYVYLWDNGEVTQHANICPGFHWVEVTDKDGCTLREDFEIEELIISLDPASAILECNLENLDICIKALPDGGIGTYFFEWWNGETADEICSGIMPGNLNVIVEDANGCKEDTSFVITSMTSECIPNVFTPDGDGINDTWSLEDAFLFSDSEIRIYGRYGKLLFESVGYNQAWDGTNEKGNDIPDGAYFYSIDIGHGVDPIKGIVTILR